MEAIKRSFGSFRNFASSEAPPSFGGVDPKGLAARTMNAIPTYAIQRFTSQVSAGIADLRTVDSAWMKAHTEYLWFETRRREEFVCITDEVAAIVARSEIQEGFALVSAMHITAAVYVNDLEYGLIEDIKEWLDRLAPRGNYRHHATGEDNGEAHLKNLVMHHQVMLPVTNGRLDLGPWQQVFYAEFDGQRRKRVIVKAMGV